MTDNLIINVLAVLLLFGGLMAIFAAFIAFGVWMENRDARKWK